MFVLRAEIVAIFEPKMVTISERNTNNYTENMQTSHFTTFRNQILQIYKFYYFLFNYCVLFHSLYLD